jgi:hypothetical protein
MHVALACVECPGSLNNDIRISDYEASLSDFVGREKGGTGLTSPSSEVHLVIFADWHRFDVVLRLELLGQCSRHQDALLARGCAKVSLTALPAAAAHGRGELHFDRIFSFGGSGRAVNPRI